MKRTARSALSIGAPLSGLVAAPSAASAQTKVITVQASWPASYSIVADYCWGKK